WPWLHQENGLIILVETFEDYNFSTSDPDLIVRILRAKCQIIVLHAVIPDSHESIREVFRNLASSNPIHLEFAWPQRRCSSTFNSTICITSTFDFEVKVSGLLRKFRFRYRFRIF